MASVNGSYYLPVFYKRSVFLWEMIILYCILFKKMSQGFVAREFTTWLLPNGFKLQYTDYDNKWGVSRMDEINEPFQTNYINEVYCRKGIFYCLLLLYMKIKAADIRGIKNWRNLENERRALENKST